MTEHIPYPEQVFGPEPKHVQEQIARGEIATDLFRGQTAMYIPNKMAEKIGDTKILELAKLIYGEEVYNGNDGHPIRLHKYESSRNIELPSCPVVIDNPERYEGHFDRTQLDNFIEAVKNEYEK